MKFYEITGSLLATGLLAIPTGVSAQDPVGEGLVALDPYVVGEALPPLDPGRAMVSMSLEQAIQRALESNLDVQSARLDPVIQRFALGAAQAAYTPIPTGRRCRSDRGRLRGAFRPRPCRYGRAARAAGPHSNDYSGSRVHDLT